MNNRQYIEDECNVDRNMLGPTISRAEFDKALKRLNRPNNKATGTDNIPAEILKNLGEPTKEHLFKFISESYEEGTVPSDFIDSRTITIPKKGKALDSANYRTIFILPHASKILLYIVKNRIKGKN